MEKSDGFTTPLRGMENPWTTPMDNRIQLTGSRLPLSPLIEIDIVIFVL